MLMHFLPLTYKNGKYYYNSSAITLAKQDYMTPDITWTNPSTPIAPDSYYKYYIRDHAARPRPREDHRHPRRPQRRLDQRLHVDIHRDDDGVSYRPRPLPRPLRGGESRGAAGAGINNKARYERNVES